MKKDLPSFKDFWIKFDDNKWTKWKKRSKRKGYGLKKGDGGLPEVGMDVTTESFMSTAFLRSEDEEITNQVVSSNDISDEQQPMAFDDNQTDNTSEFEEDNENEDLQGIIRKVNNAHLVFKRKTEDDRFEELWIFKIDDSLKNSLDVKNDILAATDIQNNKTISEDGLQKYELWTAGNVQFLHIVGLPE